MNILSYAKKLKKENYQKHKILIRYYCKLHKLFQAYDISCDISQKHRKSTYTIKLKEICIRRYSNPWTQLAAILHEFGHFLDEAQNPEIFFYEPTPITERKLVDKENMEVEISAEERAWEFAEGTARALGIELKDWYWKTKAKKLKSYYEYYSKNKQK